ncbi:MAG: hypothetical protein Q7S58_19650 [Candidatus Binatus sp.]|uniref:hypothetical protein n=1 Tax=Candidatus Binatus sp. TaxID=2811406 RepID=UPI00271592F7|nr:hypothetical protein [Candidatus Binatus sp.]MDO8434617.1 hypothetical protein [Candidatus Binatus sp.]
MSWSLGYRPIEAQAALDGYFLSLGKALYIATAFEAKVQYVLRIAKLIDFAEQTPDHESVMSFGKALRDKNLGATLRELGLRDHICAEDASNLDRARNARNYIAHEAAHIGTVYDVNDKLFSETRETLRTQLEALIKGDNLISSWVYEIEEREPAPEGIQQDYHDLVTRWVFG